MIVRDKCTELEDIDEVNSSYEEKLRNKDLLELNHNQHYDKVQEEKVKNQMKKVI